MAQTGMLPNTGADLLNPQINPMILNQILAAAQAQQGAAPQPTGGLYVAPPQNLQQSPIQGQQGMNEAESRRSRPAAIPIKPPPG